MTLESKNCKACRPKRKPPTKLSAKEIHNRVQTGDMNVLVAKHLREKQAQYERNKQAMAARKRWLKVWRVELRTALAPITREIASARKAWEYAKDKGYVDKAEFYFRYHAILKHEKAHVEYSYMTSPRRPQSARWADYLADNVFTIVREMWSTLPPNFKHSHIPMLIKYRPDGAQLADSLSATTQGERR
jgi:hypothetical protein